MRPRETISAFDSFLLSRRLSLDAVIVGGAALGLLGITSRQTRDCDVLVPDLPEIILAAAREFAAACRSNGDPLSDEWLNNGPSSLVQTLPPGWKDRLLLVFAGQALTLRSLGRADLIRSKLFALCDRAIDLPDCLALAPTDEELEEVEEWVAAQDANPDWPEHVRAVIADLEARLSRGA